MTIEKSEKLNLSKVQWDTYAETYDLLLDYSKPYQEIINKFEQCISSGRIYKNLLDIGSGTGNYSLVAARNRHVERVVAIEPEEAMAKRIESKARRENLNIEITRKEYEVSPHNEKYDAIVCVHALYTMKDPLESLRTMKAQLREGGLLFICDLGRPMDVSEWRKYLILSLISQVGIIGTFNLVWKSREIAKQNKRIRAMQESGEYWMHSLEEFENVVTSCGFKVKSRESVYRGYSDLLICTV